MINIGDRGNIVVDGIYLYTHWGGSELLETLHSALNRSKERWTGPSYLTRIIFSEMIKDDVMGLTGFGIALSPPDNEHPLVHVDTAKQTVTVEGTAPMNFKDFVATDDIRRVVQFRKFYGLEDEE